MRKLGMLRAKFEGSYLYGRSLLLTISLAILVAVIVTFVVTGLTFPLMDDLDFEVENRHNWCDSVKFAAIGGVVAGPSALFSWFVTNMHRTPSSSRGMLMSCVAIWTGATAYFLFLTVASLFAEQGDVSFVFIFAVLLVMFFTFQIISTVVYAPFSMPVGAWLGKHALSAAQADTSDGLQTTD